MRKAMAAVAVAGMLLAGLGAASPVLAEQGDTQECSAGSNGGTMVNGVCVLPALNQGQNAEEFLMNTGGGVDTWTIVSGSLPPGMQMYATYAAGSTIIYGTPAQQGTFSFTVDNVPFDDPSAPPSQGTYSITVGFAAAAGCRPARQRIHPAGGHRRCGLRAEFLRQWRRGALHLVGGEGAVPARPGAHIH